MVNSWGNYPKCQNIKRQYVSWRDQSDLFNELPVLPYGMGRSYGDSCLNASGVVLDTKYLNHMIAFNEEHGVLRCEAGVTLGTVLKLITKKGWMLPVLPGTKFVTVGGAIANDIHGKNHHVSGTFGCHVKQFELLRSNGDRLICSATKNTKMYQATIGGLGLTGLILWAEIQLKPIVSEYLEVDALPFNGLEEFIKLSTEGMKQYEYTAAWLDCQSKGKRFGRGILFQGNFLKNASLSPKKSKRIRKKTVPFPLPSFVLNRYSIGAFSQAYYLANARESCRHQIVHYDSHFFPLDNVHQWNLIYGKKGFVQYQCAVPFENALMTLTSLLKKITQSGQGSFLSVIKILGDIKSPGLLSFPMPGITLALDFPFRGKKTLTLLNELDVIVLEGKGRVYPAKDARMSKETFNIYYPKLNEFMKEKDPNFSSSFWRRMNIT